MKRPLPVGSLVLPVLFAVLPAAHGATFHVPGVYPHIQDAIDAALPGDTVLVDPGTYMENIDFKGKDISVVSSAGAAGTEIDGGQNGSVVTFANQESQSAVLQGFAITNGTGTFLGNSSYGGGIYIKLSSPTVLETIITDNHCGKGGGITCDEGSPVIRSNWIHHNSATYAAGLQVEFDSNALVEANVIDHNYAFDSGGGVEFYKSPGTFVNNLVAYNTADYYGGGISVSKASLSPVLVNNTVAYNTAYQGGGGMDIYAKIGYPVTISVDNTIFWADQAPAGPEISVRGEATLNIGFSDVAGGQALAHVDSSAGLVWGSGMVDGDPRFVNPQGMNFHLTSLSPCINRGLNAVAPATDADGDARPLMGTVDTGMDEFFGSFTLGADGFSLSASSGGTIYFGLIAGPANGGRGYVLLGSVSGTAPGVPLPGGAVLPLTWDLFTNLTVFLANSPALDNFVGVLDAQGVADASLNASSPIPGAAGITMSFAYALTAPLDFASCPVNVSITP